MTTTSYHSTRPVIADSELPAQTPATNGMALISNGATSSWQFLTAMIGTNPGQVPQATIANKVLPDQTNNGGKVLITDGSHVSWAIPSGSAMPPVFEESTDQVILDNTVHTNGSTLALTTSANVVVSVVMGDVISAAYPIGTVLHFAQMSSDPIVFTGSNVSIIGVGRSGGQADRTYGLGAHATLKKINSTTWLLYGNVDQPPA